MLAGLENPIHLLVILVIVLLLFGPKRLPEVGRSLGRGIRELRGSLGGGSKDETSDTSKEDGGADPAAPSDPLPPGQSS
jgi:TatA/E family protein of Tat protein translocase